MKISDIITDQILRMLEMSDGNATEIQRNDMAEKIGCVPSQINYVLTSRFTAEHGYIVESRRGGGGYIRITRVRIDRTSALMHIVNSIGDTIDAGTVRAILGNCAHGRLIPAEIVSVMDAALSQAVFREIPAENRNSVRAALFKQMLVALIS